MSGVEDYPRNIQEFEDRFSTEESCRAYLEQLRWPDGFCCPHCSESSARPCHSVAVLQRFAADPRAVANSSSASCNRPPTPRPPPTTPWSKAQNLFGAGHKLLGSAVEGITLWSFI